MLFLRRHAPLVAFCLVFGGSAGGCFGGTKSVRPDVRSSGGATAVDYTIWIDSDVEIGVVKVCAEGDVSAFRPALASGARALLSAHQVLGPRTYSLKVDDDGTVYPLESKDPCVHLKVDIGGTARRELSPFIAFPFPAAKTLAPDLLLWRPNDVDENLTRTATLHTAPGVKASVPWPSVDDAGGNAGTRYRIPDSTFRQMSVLAFGDLQAEDFKVGAVTVHLATLAEMSASNDDLRLWVSEAIRSVSLATGVFPVEHLQVLILPFPSPLSSKPVAFGMAARGGGAAAFFVANASASGHRFVGEWVAVHELSHLVLPFVQKPDAWLSEGLATYHQNVLRARAGLLTEKEGWFELVEGIVMAEAMAKEDGRPIAACSTEMQSERNYRQVYWTGATAALVLDVKLRLAGRPTSGLNNALGGLSAFALDGAPWTAEDVMQHVDNRTRTTLGGQLLDDATTQVFPDVWPLLERLGISWTGDDVILDDNAELVAIRRAIMAAAVPEIPSPPARRGATASTTGESEHSSRQ